MVVNRSFADQYLGPNPIGQRVPLALYRKAEWEVIGVVNDMKQGGLERAGLATMSDAAQPEMFSPYRQFDAMRLDSIFFVIRTAGDPAALAPTLRAVVREQAPHLVLDSVRTMEDRVLASLAKPRSYALVLTGFAACALAIAGVGLFGVLSYSVGAADARDWRPHGARRPNLGRGQVGAALGCEHHGGRTHLGLVTASLLAGFLRTILVGVEPFDPVTFGVTPVVLALAAALACAAPAHRAARIDPLRALRADW